MSRSQVEQLSYVPVPLLARLRGRVPGDGLCERFPAAVLFADLAGSTAVGEILARHGSIGAETLGRLLNAYIAAVVDAVHACGGEVAKFTGDGLLALWDGETPAGVGVLRSAAHCGLAIQDAVGRLAAAGVSGVAEAPLAMRVGVGWGDVSLTLVATEGEFLEGFFAGPAVRETAAACAAGKPWTVVATPAAHAVLVSRAVRSPGAVALPLDAATIGAAGPPRILAPRPSPVDLPAELQRLVSPAVLAGGGPDDGDWDAQLRRVSALFVNLLADPGGAEPDVLEAAGVVRRAVVRHGGMLARIGVDEKGVVFLAVFGLAARTHEDDPARCIGAALEIADGLRTANLRAGIGVATGRAFCGALGNRRAREFTVIGDVVNVAARLMQVQPGDVVSDAETRRLTADRYLFEALPAQRPKGRVHLVTPYLLRGLQASGSRSLRPMIGRSEELESLLGRVRRLVDDGAAAAVIVEGEAGIGKSTLLAALAREARSLPVAIVTGAGDPIEMDVPYRVWGQVLRALFGGGDGVAPLRVDHRDADERSWWEARRSLLEALLGHDTGPLPWEGESLAVEMQEVVVRALACATVERPVLLLLEDAHWFDSSSWRVVRLAIEQVPRAMLVVATRPLPADTAAEPGRLLLLPGLVRLVLGPLAAAEAEALARRSLDVGGRSTPLVELLLERTRGHPMFIAELARSLGTGRDGVSAGAVTAERLAGGPWADELPPTVEALLAARIDALPARHQLVLKVGSVLGPTFALPTLHSVFPAELDAVTLAADVDELCEAGLLQRGRGADEFEFRHAIARDAAYVTLLHAQRRQLHEAVARWLEGQDGGDSAAGVARLAYHWTEAATVDAALVPTAIEWLGRAGEMAAARYANREVLRFLGQAIAFLGSGGPMAVSLAQRVRWERLLGEACFGLGELERAGVHLRRALELAPIAHPRTRRAMAAGLARGVVRQAVSRMRPPAAAADRATAEPRVLLEEAASAYNFLQIIAFIEMDGLAAAHAAIRSANLAESGGASRPLVYALSGVGLLVGMFSGAAARRYHALALATAERLGDRRATLGPWYVRGYLHMRAGGWTDAESAFRQAQAVAAEYGDRRFWEMCEMQLGCVRYTCGDFAAGLERYRAAEASARRRGDVDAQALALVGAATALAHLGATRDGLHCLANVDEWLGPDFIGVRDRGIRINALGTRALLLWRNGARGEAMAAARAAAACIASSPLLAHYALAGYAAVAEVAVAAARAGADDPWVRRTALRGLRRFRFAFPFARAQELLWRGADAARRGRRRRALRLLRAGLRSATELALVHEQHLLRRELAALAGPR